MTTQRIVSLLAAGTEILYGIGCGDRVVGVSHECDFPAAIEKLPRLTRARVDDSLDSRQIDEQVRAAVAEKRALYEIDVDRLAALAPDLIVTQAQCDVCAVSLDEVNEAVATHAALAHARVVALNPVSLDGITRDIRQVGQAAGCTEGAEALIAGLEERVAKIQSLTAPLGPGRRPRVVCMEWIDPPMVGGNWMPELIDLAGGTQSLAAAGQPSPQVPWEEIVRFDPDVVVVMPCGFDLERTIKEMATLRSFDGWSQLAAVRTGRVYAVDGNALFNRSGPRIVDSLEIMAHLLHPDLAPAPSDGSVWRRVGY